MECDPSNPDLTVCLLHIVSGTPDEISNGWTNLRQIDEEIRETIDLHEIMEILINIVGTSVKNYNEIPKLLIYFSNRLKDNPFEVNANGNNYTLFLRNTNGNDISLFANIIQTIYDNKQLYLPTFKSNEKFCEAIVTCLADFQMPRQTEKVGEFKSSSARIQKYLADITHRPKPIEERDLIVKCLETLYKIISDLGKNPMYGAALVGVLKLVEPSQDAINQAVQLIITRTSSSDDNLEKALRTLCIWLSQWLKEDCLSLWISAFITGLEEKQKFGVLTRVTDDCLKTMIQRLELPIARPHSMAVVFLMLCRQSTPNSFHKVIKDIENVLMKLSKDPSAEKWVQNLVNITKALMMRFPGYPIYETLEKSLPIEPKMDVVKKILGLPKWTDDSKDEIQNICFINNGKVGLTNLGNTCYMNSVLQALCMTRQFCQEVINYKPPTDTNANVILGKLQNLFALLLYSKRMSLSPTEILHASRPSYFTPGQQQDSSEFLCHLLDVLYEQEKSNPQQTDDLELKILKTTPEAQEVEDMTVDSEGCGIKRWITEEDLTEGTTLERKTQSLADFSDGGVLEQTPQLSDSHSDSTDSGIQSVGGEDTSSPNLVHRVFGGESKITYQCTQCDTSSHNTDKFRDLQLCFPEEILENQEVSVQDLINYYLTPENLTGDNKYRCDKCMKLCDAQRIIKLLRAPSHLILTLKHFHYDSESRLRTKLRHKVTYSERIQLPLSTQMSTGAETYQLYAAVVHSGYSMDYGHYFTYASDSKKNWYKFNDSYVSKTTLDDFKSLEPPDTPYILFYEKLTKTDGIYEDDKPPLASLNKHIQELVERDTAAYNEEMKQHEEKKKNQRGRHISLLRRNDNSDDENPPPSSCRGAIDIPANQFLY